MNISYLLAREHSRDLREAAARARIGSTADTPVTRVTLREASAADVDRVRHLAELDSARAPCGPALVAEVDGRLRAVLPLDGSPPIADPFHRGADLIELLRVRASQIGRGVAQPAQR